MPVYKHQVTKNAAFTVIDEVKKEEKQVILRIREFLPEAIRHTDLGEKELKSLDLYLSSYWTYFDGTRFNMDELNLFNDAMNHYVRMMFNREFRCKKKFLENQLDFLS